MSRAVVDRRDIMFPGCPSVHLSVGCIETQSKGRRKYRVNLESNPG